MKDSNTSPDCSYFTQASVKKINTYYYIYYVLLFVWPNTEITPFIPVLAGRNLHTSQIPSHQRRDVWLTNGTPKDAHALLLFYTSGTPHARHSRSFWTLREAISLVTSCFLPFGVAMKGIPHSFLVIFYFSRLSGSSPVFYLTGDGCWIHINVGCSACIHSTPLVVSLNDKPRLDNRKQQSVGSAFQFHY